MTFERVVLAIGAAVFYTWISTIVLVDIWLAQIVPMGAPVVGFWWMFWAMAVLRFANMSMATGSKAPETSSKNTLVTTVLGSGVWGLLWWGLA